MNLATLPLKASHVCIVRPHMLLHRASVGGMSPPLSTACRQRTRHAVISNAGSSDSSIEFAGDTISKDEASKFERIAAALVAKLGEVQAWDYDEDELEGDDEEHSSGAHDDAEQLDEVSVGDTMPADELKLLQSKLEERRAAGSTAGSSGSSRSSSSSRPLVLGTIVPRAKRQRQIPTEHLPKVAIVGRPNVGKSALFNRLSGTSTAVVFDEPGITRDRLYTRASWGNTDYVLIDTGGLMSDATHLPPDVRSSPSRSITAAGLPQAIERQAAAGVAEADSVVLLVDGQAGLQPGDREILGWLRTAHPNKPLLLAVNKCENSAKADIMAADFWELGLTPLTISAISGTGTGELLDLLMASLPSPSSAEEEDIDDKPLAIAIVGRPNVGKSSLLNAICGEERSIVCDMSGTTRDAVDTQITLPDGKELTLIDTAGIRRRARVADSQDSCESLSVDRALRAMRRAEVVVLVIDAAEGVTQQDFRLSELAASEGRAVVVAINKWDLVDHSLLSADKMIEDVKAQLREVSWASAVCTSAHKGRRVPDVLAAVLAAGEEHRRRVSTATLNMVLREATNWKSPPTSKGSLKKGKIYYATQAGIRPPSFVFFVNEAKLFSDDYKRYMERQLRTNIGFPGTPLRLLWRGKAKKERTSAAGAARNAASAYPTSPAVGGGSSPASQTQQQAGGARQQQQQAGGAKQQQPRESGRPAGAGGAKRRTGGGGAANGRTAGRSEGRAGRR